MALQKLIECVPNFSEGRDMNIINQITAEIQTVEGVRLIDVDPGKATNRTVVTMVGTPDEVCEAAFRAVKRAAELIDMSKHHGAHPRFGATDVCPLVPVSNITMEETVEYARKLAKRIGDELGISVYCYENAAFKPERRNLAACRAGEYEALPQRVTSEEWKPDFGPAKFNAKSGATAVRKWEGRDATRVSQSVQGYWLVHRRIRHCTGFYQPYEHRYYTIARCLRRMCEKGRCSWCACYRVGTCGSCAAQGNTRCREVLPS